ncbi:MAG: homoserine O-succinyltransferase [Kangiellaceae bacterium]|nr:homoserine O-succinyltransferase [Kangiellaceae bacterium]
MHLFIIPEIERSKDSQAWIDEYYKDFDEVKCHGLDALIISSANPKSKELSEELFWPGLIKVIDWAKDSVTSVLCACLATQAVLDYLYNIKRTRLTKKNGAYFSID